MKVRITVKWKSGAKVRYIRDIAYNPYNETQVNAGEILETYMLNDMSAIRKITVKPYTGN